MTEQKTTALAVQTPETQAWEVMQRQCVAFISSGFLPDHITKGCDHKTAIAKALTIAQKGKELGIPPLQAFSSITVIKGKPCLSAELMLALCFQRVRGFSASFVTPPEKAATECTVIMKRQGGLPQHFKFTMDDAKNANLLGNDVWRKYPQAMLRARVTSAACRAVAPDAIMGCYTPEELGGPVLEAEVVESEALAPAPEVTTGQSGAKDTASNPELVTDAQIKRLYAVGAEFGYGHDELKSMVWDLYKKEHLKDLTKPELQAIFEDWEGTAVDRQAAQADAV